MTATVILGEVRFGILLLARGRRRSRLERWFDVGVQRLHCLPWDAATGLRWAELLADLRVSGRAMPIKDSLIAATALVHRLIVVTRNRSDFETTEVEIDWPAERDVAVDPSSAYAATQRPRRPHSLVVRFTSKNPAMKAATPNPKMRGLGPSGPAMRIDSSSAAIPTSCNPRPT